MSLSTVGNSELRKKVLWPIRYNWTSLRRYDSVFSKTFGDRFSVKLGILTFFDSQLWGGGVRTSFCRQLDLQWDVKIFWQLAIDFVKTLKCVARIRSGKCVIEKYFWSLWWKSWLQSVSSTYHSSSVVALLLTVTNRRVLAR